MVRVKKPIPTESQLETMTVLNEAKQKFAADLVELEKAKRNFSTMFVDAVMRQIEAMLPKEVLNQKAVDFIKANGPVEPKIYRSVCTQTKEVHFADE